MPLNSTKLQKQIQSRSAIAAAMDAGEYRIADILRRIDSFDFRHGAIRAGVITKNGNLTKDYR